MLILQPKRKHKYLSCETFIWKKNGKIIHGKPSFWKKIQISSRDCLLLGKNTNIFRERPSFWEKTQISFSYGYFFWKTTNPMRVTATFSGKTTNIFQLRLLFLEKQRIPCVQRLQIDSYEKKRERKVSITPSFHSLHPELCLYDRWSFYVTLLLLCQQWSEISLLTLILLCSRYSQKSFL